MKRLFLTLFVGLLVNACYVEYSYQIAPKYEFVVKDGTVTIYKVPYKSMQMWVNTDYTVTIKVMVKE